MITRKQYIKKVRIYKDSLSFDVLFVYIMYLFRFIPLYISKTRLS
jgi:hypothetical protein